MTKKNNMTREDFIDRYVYHVKPGTYPDQFKKDLASVIEAEVKGKDAEIERLRTVLRKIKRSSSHLAHGYARQTLGSDCCGAELIHLETYGYDECSDCGKTYRSTNPL